MQLWINMLIILLIYGYTFCVYLPNVMKNMAYSRYFQYADTDIEKFAKEASQRNALRYYKAQLYLAEYYQGSLEKEHPTDDKMKATFAKDKHEVDVAIGIVTKNRELPNTAKLNLGYLTQTFASLHREAVADNIFTKNIFICNVDKEPDKFKEVIYLEEFVSIFTRHETDSDMDKFLDSITDLYEMQREDYVYCLEQAMRHTKAKYVIIFEDDVPVVSGFFDYLHYHLNTNLKLVQEKYDIPDTQLGFIKLMYPERWRGFSNTFSSVGEILSFGVFGGLIYICLCRIIYVTSRKLLHPVLPRSIRQMLTPSKPNVRQKGLLTDLNIQFAAGALYTALLCYMIGRPYLIKMKLWTPYLNALHRQAPGCCTLAMLYPQDKIPDLIDYLSNIKCHIDFAIDSAVDEFAAINELETFMVEPNIATHIGMISNLRAYAKEVAEYLYI